MTALEFYRKHLHALVSTGKTEYKTEPEIFDQANAMEKEQSLKMPPYNLDELANELLYSKYPFHPPNDSGYWLDMYKSGFQKALELLTFKSE